jgi:hypothetical protein
MPDELKPKVFIDRVRLNTGKPPHFYLSCSLTVVTETETYLQDLLRIGAVAEEYGTVYQPFLHSSPTTHGDMSPAEVFALDYQEVLRADVVCCVCNAVPSFGIGIEAAWAHQAGKPLILIYSAQLPKPSRLLRGLPNIVAEVVEGNIYATCSSFRCVLRDLLTKAAA